MESTFLERVKTFLKLQRRKKVWYRCLCAMAAVVIFATTYMLILPAITMENTSFCGIEGHTHDEKCNTKKLICGFPEEPEKKHEHSENCYVEQKKLICELQESEGHVHSESCQSVQSSLTCGMEESAGHTHSESCIQRTEQIVCGLAESAGHVHSDACMTASYSVGCGLEEGEEHVHDDTCLIASYSVGCGIEESAGHIHDSSCISVSEAVVCGLAESTGHIHDTGCYTESVVITCGQEESEGHTHTDSCYVAESIISCGYTDEMIAEQKLKEHLHTENCYKEERTCTKKEHEHVLSCYSNPNADLESASAWERTLPGSLSGVWADDLLSVAKSQLGYTESSSNYEVVEGKKKGYSRYGAWYGAPYGDWCAMYVSFCLNYARIPQSAMPWDCNCNSWIGTLSARGQYRGASGYVPEAGDLIFFSMAYNGISDHVGIVSSCDGSSVTTIEGNSSNQVEYNTYSIGDGRIMGYGELPENPALQPEVTPEATPEATPEVTPEATPEVTPEATPEVTPEATPEVTPETTPEVTPEATPETTPEVTPEVTPEIAPEEIPEVTPEAVQEETQEISPDEKLVSFLGKTSGLLSNSREGLLTGEDEKLEIDVENLALAGDGYGDLSPYIQWTDTDNDIAAYDPATGHYKVDVKLNIVNVPTVKIKESGYDFIYTFPKDVLIPNQLLNKEEPFYDSGTGSMAGYYEFVYNETTGQYSVILRFDQNYVDTKTGDRIDGFLSFKGELWKNIDLESGNIQIKDNDNNTTLITIEKITYPEDETEKYDISISKNSTYNKDSGVLEYTVQVFSKKGTPSNISLVDILTAQNVDFGNIQSLTVYNATRVQSTSSIGYTNIGDAISNPSYSYDSSSDKLSMTLPQISEAVQNSDGSYTCNGYVIKYTYDTSSLPAGENYTVNNTVSGSSEEGDDGDHVTDTDSTDITINKNMTFTKNGSYDSATGSIKWEMKVNANNVNIFGSLITDEMFDEINSSGIMISPDNGYEILRSGNVITGIKFLSETGKNNVNTQSYTITYYTDVDETYGSVEYSNDAIWDKDGDLSTDDDQIGVGDKVTITGGNVSKSLVSSSVASDKQSAEVIWKANITAISSGITAGTVITDTMSSSSGPLYMTSAQVRSWDGKLYYSSNNSEISANYTIEFLGSDGNWYVKNSVVDTFTYSQFRITFNQDFVPSNGNNIYFQYSTTANLANVSEGNTTFTNSVSFNGKDASADYTYTKGGVVKKDGNGNTGTTDVSSTGEISWKVEVLTDSTDFYTLNIKDTLPKGVKLESLTFRSENQGWSAAEIPLGAADAEGNYAVSVSNYAYLITGSYNSTTGEVALAIKHADTNSLMYKGAKITVTYNCVVDEAYLNENTTVYVFKNTVEVKTDDKFYGSDDQTQNWTESEEEEEKPGIENAVGKNGKWYNNTRTLDYSVSINEPGADLNEEGDTILVEDILSYQSSMWINGESREKNISLLQGTVQLFKAKLDENGNVIKDASGFLVADTSQPVTNWSWTYEENGTDWMQNIIKATVPDNTPMVLKYTYQVYMELEENETAQIQVSNSVKVAALYSDTSNNWNDEWEKQEVEIGVVTGKAYTFYKVEAGDYKEALDDAEFTVFKFENGNYVDTGKKFVTDNGAFKISWDENFQLNTLYKIFETKAPQGYKLPDTIQEFYFYFGDSTYDTITLPTNLPSNAIDLNTTSHTEYVENVKIPSSITVEKKWFDEEGADITSTYSGSIKFDLYQVTLEEEPDGPLVDSDAVLPSGGSIYLSNLEINQANNWSWTSEELPISSTDDEGNTVYYLYYIVEHEVENYDTTYDGNVGIIDGKITINNEEKESLDYVLPETGGTGTVLYTVSGLILMAGVTLLYMNRKFRRKEDHI